MCTVVNKYKVSMSDPDVVYIGRGSVWGNPYIIGVDGTREEVVAKFGKLLWNLMKSGSITKKDLLSLDGKRLACYCAPQACHGDMIKRAVKWSKENL